MGNRQARELQLRQEQEEREARLEKLRTEPRHATARVSAFDIGTLRIQVWVCPSFFPASFWEVRQLGKEWLLYKSDVVERFPDLILIGFEKASFASPRLLQYFQALTSLALPLKPDLSNCSGRDGESYGLGVFGDLASQVKFEWWSDFPSHWKPMVRIAKEMLSEFPKASANPS